MQFANHEVRTNTISTPFRLCATAGLKENYKRGYGRNGDLSSQHENYAPEAAATAP